MLKITTDGLTPIWHRMHCTHMAKVGWHPRVKMQSQIQHVYNTTTL